MTWDNASVPRTTDCERYGEPKSADKLRDVTSGLVWHVFRLCGAFDRDPASLVLLRIARIHRGQQSDPGVVRPQLNRRIVDVDGERMKSTVA